MTGTPPETPDATAGTDPAETPYCYRHPDRETYVRCVRCDRPICPDCMNSAAVGFQCTECVRSGARTVRTPRTQFGGLIPTNVGQVTRVLIGLNVVVFVLQQLDDQLTSKYGLLPLSTLFVDDGVPVLREGVADGEYQRLLTAAFLHSGILHLFFNMYALLLVGPTLEAALGRLRFVGLYLLSALGGSTLAYLLMDPHSLAVGASGAIFGMFGALFVVARRMGSETGGILGLIGINLVITFAVPQISWQGHLGGLITGVLVALAFAYAPRARRDLIQGGAAVGVLAALVVGVLLRTSALT